MYSVEFRLTEMSLPSPLAQRVGQAMPIKPQAYIPLISLLVEPSHLMLLLLQMQTLSM